MTLVDGRSLTRAGRRPEFDELRFLRPTPTSSAQNIDFSILFPTATSLPMDCPALPRY